MESMRCVVARVWRPRRAAGLAGPQDARMRNCVGRMTWLSSGGSAASYPPSWCGRAGIRRSGSSGIFAASSAAVNPLQTLVSGRDGEVANDHGDAVVPQAEQIFRRPMHAADVVHLDRGESERGEAAVEQGQLNPRAGEALHMGDLPTRRS